MKSNLISKCLTFYVLLETCPAEAVIFTAVNGLWFSSKEKKKKKGCGGVGKNATNITLPTV